MIKAYPNYAYLEFYTDKSRLAKFPLFQVESKPVWDLLDDIESSIKSFVNRFNRNDTIPNELILWIKKLESEKLETVIHSRQGLVLNNDLVLSEYDLFIGKGTVIEPNAIIKTPVHIGSNSEIRHGAYIRGNVITGKHCTIGHDTEVKNAVFGDYTEAGHFAYIGDSILGSFVNLGAGTKLANLPFRTLNQKEKSEFPQMKIKFSESHGIKTREKVGVFLGDGVETGCNSTLAPTTFVGKNSWIYPCLYLKKGFYPENSIIKLDEEILVVQKKL